MALSTGTRIGPYQIVDAIGAGGMGEVYRATDTRLKRDVAIKILPDAFANDQERLARFQREAELLATLNHPNIAQIYGLEDRALILELVEGPTLADRIAQKPVPLDETLPIARQIADALAAAHERGIVHRDLKPANIKLTPDGTVKVLDFGLAKATLEASGSRLPASELSHSPTITSPAHLRQGYGEVGSMAGAILGTAAYMSPEQAKGRPVDRRADIWAFGVVLYEMVTGKRLFEGEDLTDTIANVVKQQPDLTGVPVEVRHAINACLQKDPTQRLQAIGDWKLLVDNARAALPHNLEPPRTTRIPWLVAAAALILAAGALTALAFVAFREDPQHEERSVRLSVPVPPDSQVGFLELSPDGSRLVLGIFADGRTLLHVRPLDSAALTPLPRTTNARTPFWSPDGRSIAFFADGSLKVIPATGGPPEVICTETGMGRGGTWNRDGVIVFSTQNGRLHQVDIKSRTCSAVGKDDDGYRASFPVFLPDGRHFLYFGGEAASPGIQVAALDDFPGRKLLSDFSGVVYAPARPDGTGHLLFQRDGRLIAQPFNAEALELGGEPFVVAEQLANTFSRPQVAASAAADGTLLYLSGGSSQSQLTWVDRNGRELGKVGPLAFQRDVNLSSSGNAVAITRIPQAPNSPTAIWFHDVERGSETRVTIPGSNGARGAVWSPDGSRISFTPAGPERGGGPYQKNIITGDVDAIPIDADGAPLSVSDWSRDGRYLIYTRIDPKTRADIWYVSLESNKPAGQPVLLLGSDNEESQGQLSPDGRWLAYSSTESGRSEVYVRPFPAGEGVWKVSANGAAEPRWSADGRELFFNTGVVSQIRLETVAIKTDSAAGVHVGPSQRLFEIAAPTVVIEANSFSYSPHPDGQRFLVNALADQGERTVHVITNWQKATGR